MNNAEKKVSREASFVGGIIMRCQQDKGLAARLSRADNPATEYQSWDLLVAYGVDLEKDWQRLPFAVIASYIAKTKMKNNGNVPLGQAIAMAYSDGQTSDQAKARLRRLLACDNLDELCRVLRPILSLITSRVGGQNIDCTRLLRQMTVFGVNQQRVKTQWATEFYGRRDKDNESELESEGD